MCHVYEENAVREWMSWKLFARFRKKTKKLRCFSLRLANNDQQWQSEICSWTRLPFDNQTNHRHSQDFQIECDEQLHQLKKTNILFGKPNINKQLIWSTRLRIIFSLTDGFINPLYICPIINPASSLSIDKTYECRCWFLKKNYIKREAIT